MMEALAGSMNLRRSRLVDALLKVSFDALMDGMVFRQGVWISCDLGE